MRRLAALTVVVAIIAGGSVGAAERPVASGSALWEVELDVAKAADEVATLRRAGAEVVVRLDRLRVVVAAPGDALPDGLRARRWRPDAAVAPALRQLDGVAAKRFAAGVPVIVAVADDAAATALGLRLAAVEVIPAWRAERPAWVELGVLVPAERLAATVAALPGAGLIWADLQPPVRLANHASAWRGQSGVSGETPIFAAGITGEGEVVAVMDTGIDVDSCYFWDEERGLPVVNDATGTGVDLAQRKVLAVDFYWAADWPDPGVADWDSHGHGSHVAGSVAGDGATRGVHDGNDGMAPAARLVIQDGGYAVDPCGDLPGLGCPMRSLEPMFQQAWEQGARIHSSSWGDEEDSWPPNRYTERTADVDRFVWQHPEMVVLFAAGNGGSWGDDTIGSPATGKNLIAVGASLHGDFPLPCAASFSSRGWTADGRVKPDVLAPGQGVMSASSDRRVDSFGCEDAVMSGTSMATPTAAGLAALVRQYYRDGRHPALGALTPSAALVKATLIAAAVDVTTLGCATMAPVPSRDQGWGLVQLDRALFFPGDERASAVVDRPAAFAASGDAPFELTVATRPGGWLKAVLVWTDPPSSSLAAANLVNDLDLVVEGPAGRFLGNAFADGVSVAGGEADRVNNVEVVWLPAVEAGRWRVSVTPNAVSDGPQGFALVVTGHVEAAATRRPGDRVAP